jgi:hypothetical protein
MAKVYSRPYTHICSSSISIFSEENSSPCKASKTRWARWRITETARRTLFFCNILNYFSNRDHISGSQLPYYEPLDDKLILSMPLPCSHAAWVACSEEEWLLAMETQDQEEFKKVPGKMCESLSSEVLKNVLSRYTKEYLLNEIGSGFGFENSDELRRLIILCACEQFS